MIKMTINNEVYEVPQVLTVEQWSQLIKWDFLDESNWPRLINIVTNAPIELLKEAPREPLELGIVFIASIMNKREKVAVKDFDTLRLGEWIDLDVYLTMGVDKTIKDILKVLEVEVENAHQAQWIIDELVKWRSHVYKSYSALFGIDEYSKAEEEYQPTANEGMKSAKGWYKVLVELSNDDPLKVGPVTELGYREAFNFMALRKEKALEEKERQLKQKRQYDLQRNSR
jgi:hypothetical protein